MGKITVNKGTAGPANQICVAGIAGSVQKLYTDASYVKDCTNIGEIEVAVPTTFTAVNVAGIMAHCNTTNANIAYSGHKQYSKIKALGFNGKVGAIMGIARAEATLASGCAIGGSLVFATEDSEDNDGNPIIKDAEITLAEDNYLNYVYASGNGTTTTECSFLGTQPTVNLTTTPVVFPTE